MLRKYLLHLIVISTTILSAITITLLVIFLNMDSKAEDYSDNTAATVTEYTTTIETTTLLLTTNSTSQIQSTIATTPETGNYVFQLFNRDQWAALPSKTELDENDVPLHTIIISHTATSLYSTQEKCKSQIKNIQINNMLEKLDDIAYNFLICGDGAAYEGRGWDKMGAHTRSHNKGSLGIGFVGNFETTEPPENTLMAAQALIQEGIKLGKLTLDYNLYGQKQLKNTMSPGKYLFAKLELWPHFDSSVNIKILK